MRPQLTVCRYFYPYSLAFACTLFFAVCFQVCLHTFGRQRHWNVLRWPPAILLRDLLLLINTHKDKSSSSCPASCVISRAKVRFDTLVVWGCGDETFLDGRSFHGHQLLLSDGCTAPGKCAPESFRRRKLS